MAPDIKTLAARLNKLNHIVTDEPKTNKWFMEQVWNSDEFEGIEKMYAACLIGIRYQKEEQWKKSSPTQ